MTLRFGCADMASLLEIVFYFRMVDFAILFVPPIMILTTMSGSNETAPSRDRRGPWDLSFPGRGDVRPPRGIRVLLGVPSCAAVDYMGTTFHFMTLGVAKAGIGRFKSLVLESC